VEWGNLGGMGLYVDLGNLDGMVYFVWNGVIFEGMG